MLIVSAAKGDALMGDLSNIMTCQLILYGAHHIIGPLYYYSVYKHNEVLLVVSSSALVMLE